MEEEVTNEARGFRSDINEALLKERKKWSSEADTDFVKGLKLWEDLKPRRRVQALCACVGRDEAELSFEDDAVMEVLFVIRVFAIVLAGHAEMLSIWQSGAVLAMTELGIFVSCRSVNFGGTIHSES